MLRNETMILDLCGTGMGQKDTKAWEAAETGAVLECSNHSVPTAKCFQQFVLPAITEPNTDHLRRDDALPNGERLKIFVLADDGQAVFGCVLPDSSVIGCR